MCRSADSFIHSFMVRCYDRKEDLTVCDVDDDLVFTFYRNVVKHVLRSLAEANQSINQINRYLFSVVNSPIRFCFCVSAKTSSFLLPWYEIRLAVSCSMVVAALVQNNLFAYKTFELGS